MNKFLIGIISAIVVLCLVQVLPINAQQAQYTLTVDIKDIELIGEGLGMLPYNRVALTMGKLQAQINEQNAAKAKKEEPVKKE